MQITGICSLWVFSWSIAEPGISQPWNRLCAGGDAAVTARPAPLAGLSPRPRNSSWGLVGRSASPILWKTSLHPGGEICSN